MGKIKVVLFDADTLSSKEVEVTSKKCIKGLLGGNPQVIEVFNEDLYHNGIRVLNNSSTTKENYSACIHYSCGYDKFIRGNLIFMSFKEGYIREDKLSSLNQEQLDVIYKFINKRKDFPAKYLKNLLTFDAVF